MSFWMFIASGVMFFSGFVMMLGDVESRGGKILVGLAERAIVWALLVRILEHLP